MAQGWTEAEYEVVSGPRLGARHPADGRWRYAGPDAYGRPRWRRAARLNRAQFFVALCFGAMGLKAAVFLIAEALAHH